MPMPTSRRRTVSAVALGIAATALALGPTGTAAASIPMCPTDNMCIYDYYDSSEMENSIGRGYVYCDGTSEIVGETSPWIRMTADPCPS